MAIAIMFAQDILVNIIKRILDLVSVNTSANDTLSLAKEIASYERNLALVSEHLLSL